MSEILCDWFGGLAPELALGILDSHWTAEMLDHAAGCLRCQTRLDEFVLLGERLLLAAPQMLPPANFEDQAVARMRSPASASPESSSFSLRRRTALAAAAAVAVVGFSVGGSYAVAHRSPAHPATALAVSRTGTIVRADGTTAGTITLTAQPRPLALVTVDHPRQGSGLVTCELLDADGQATTIGSWSFDQIARGAWAVGIDPALLSAERMDLRSTAGAVVASAVLR
jgi:hypothetical protein